jgi:hypothetical protein
MSNIKVGVNSMNTNNYQAFAIAKGRVPPICNTNILIQWLGNRLKFKTKSTILVDMKFGQ